MPSLLDDNDKAAAMARYDARNGFAPADPKVTLDTWAWPATQGGRAGAAGWS